MLKFKKNSSLIILGVILLSISFFAGSSATAAEKKKNQQSHEIKMGYADLSALLVFHPYMQYYSLDSNIFIRPLKDGLTKTEFLGQIRDRQEKYRILKENTEYEVKIMQQDAVSVENEINKLRVKVSREQALANQKYSEEYTKLFDEKSRKERTEAYHRQLSQLDRDYYDEKKKLDELKNGYYSKINDSIGKIHEVDYLNDKDSSTFFSEILKEISETLSQVASEKNVPFVLNSNFISSFTPIETIVDNVYVNSPVTIKTTLPLAPNYGYLLDSVDDSSYSTTSEIEAKKESIKAECVKLFNKRADVARLFSKYRILNQMVLVGGVDLTPDVLEALLKKHKVSEYKIPVIISALRDLYLPKTESEIIYTQH